MNEQRLSVLVTGASGFIGRHVVSHLADQGHEVLALDYRPPAERFPAGVRFYHCDLRDGRLPRYHCDAVVHLAALAGVRPSLDRPAEYEQTNVLATVRLLEWCRDRKVPTFVFASSSSVYGPDVPLPAKEDGPVSPMSPYALTKLHAEQWGQLYARLHGLRFVALRFFSVWGPGQRPDLALEKFRRQVTAGETVKIHGDGSQRRDLTHVEDVARAVGLALRWNGTGSLVLNVGTGRNHSVSDMLEAVKKWTGFTPRVEHGTPHPADVPETLASLVAVGRELGWQPSIFFPNEAIPDGKKV